MEYEALDDENSSMAVSMGFSSFGSQLITRKRHYNNSADSFVDGQDLPRHNHASKRGARTGGNSIPINAPRKLGSSNQSLNKCKDNLDEINLEEDNNSPNKHATLKLPSTNGSDRDETQDSFDKNADSSIKSVASESQIADASAPTSAVSLLNFHKEDLLAPENLLEISESGGNGQFNNWSKLSHRQVNQTTNYEKQKFQHNENWYEDYYDQSFNENPWEELEISNGLQPLGCWSIPK